MKNSLISKLFLQHFDCFGENLATLYHFKYIPYLDLVRCPLQLDDILESNLLSNSPLSLGVVDGEISGKMISKNQLL
jgi:5-methyltetrahydropteroyltriglutamate--homocysteine methyltransferase